MVTRKATRAAQGSGTIRQRSNGQWEARYTLGRDPGTGKQIQRSIYGKTQTDVLKKLRQIQSSIDDNTYNEPTRMTVSNWLDVWQAEYLSDIKPGTRYTYGLQVNVHIVPALGAIQLQKLQPHAIQTFCNDLSRLKGLSPKTIKNVHGVLHAALEKAVFLGYIKNNPAAKTALPRLERPQLTILPEEQLPAFVEALSDDIYGSIMYIALFTGMRQGEVMGLTWDCVDFESGTILVRHQLIRYGSSKAYSLAPLKNDKPRLLAPAPSIMQELREVRKQQMEYKLRAGAAWNNHLNLVFTNEIGTHLSKTTVYNHFKRIAANIGIPGLRFHDLRHSFAVNSLQSGDDVKTVQEALGHHTAAFTLDVYGFVTDKMRRDSGARMEQFIQQNGARKRCS